MYKLITNNPFIDKNLADYKDPIGARYDDHRNISYFTKVAETLGKSDNKVEWLELGCALGGIIGDLLREGHKAIGLEGTGWPIFYNNKTWREYYNTNLFTCDVSKPFQVTDLEDKYVKFDVVSCWEVIEHLVEGDLPTFFENVKRHMKDDGIFIGSISEAWTHGGHHNTVMPLKQWYKYYIDPNFRAKEWPIDIEPHRIDVLRASSSMVFWCYKKELN